MTWDTSVLWHQQVSSHCPRACRITPCSRKFCRKIFPNSRSKFCPKKHDSQVISRKRCKKKASPGPKSSGPSIIGIWWFWMDFWGVLDWLLMVLDGLLMVFWWVFDGFGGVLMVFDGPLMVFDDFWWVFLLVFDGFDLCIWSFQLIFSYRNIKRIILLNMFKPF